jgi:hypothetical protein
MHKETPPKKWTRCCDREGNESERRDPGGMGQKLPCTQAYQTTIWRGSAEGRTRSRQRNPERGEKPSGSASWRRLVLQRPLVSCAQTISSLPPVSLLPSPFSLLPSLSVFCAVFLLLPASLCSCFAARSIARSIRVYLLTQEGRAGDGAPFLCTTETGEHLHMHIHACARSCMHACAHARMHAFICTQHACIHASIHTRTACMHPYTHALHACIHASIHTRTACMHPMHTRTACMHAMHMHMHASVRRHSMHARMHS